MPLSKHPYELGKTACYVSAIVDHINSTLNSNMSNNAPVSLPGLSQFIITVAGQIKPATGVVFDKAMIQTSDLGETAIQASDLFNGYFRYLSSNDDSLSYDRFVIDMDTKARKIAANRGIQFLN